MALQFFLVAVTVFFASPAFAQLEIPEIQFDSAPNLLKLPADTYLGEAVGVATNSKGHIFVFTRTGSHKRHDGNESSVLFARIVAAYLSF